MGLFSAGDIDAGGAQAEFQAWLIEGEQVLAAFRTIRDTVLLTNFRFIFVDVQGLTGSKKDIQSVPWRSVARFSFETAGTFDIDTDMKVWISGLAVPIEVKVSRKSDPQKIQHLMARLVIGC
ncbi:PH domain-containing protein [Sphingopyxis sp. YF1]|uniref:PH domain-containing protein n=1 Tax=Sphingopyxis sp. YF1 TaxID=2482763 RepID=UPI002416A619|nr:PH domain-containing protein [Sphingopyxis sp. YF1]UNU42464.1 PH domain-containing protein [Sphingopyxis sp. YF1]